MAKLSAHGTEVGRYQRTNARGIRITYSLRSDGRALYKEDWIEDGKRVRTGWKLSRYVKVQDAEAALVAYGFRLIGG
jgi:hypothetical protein